jgi:hypothetical protein
MADHPSPHRRFQFRLRTLLILVAVVAIVCPIAIDRYRLIQERDEARERAAALQKELLHLQSQRDVGSIVVPNFEPQTFRPEPR